MQAIEKTLHPRSAWARQQGIASVEFAFVALIFFTVFFGMLEVARAMYICNTLQEVTRRAAALAANADFSNDTAMQQVRNQAVFRTSAGTLAFAEPITEAHIKIDYMWIKRNGTTLSMEAMPSASKPASPAANYANCLNDPYSQTCIRMVRARVCAPSDDDACGTVAYRTLASLIPLPFKLPVSVTITNAETLGMPSGAVADPCGC